MTAPPADHQPFMTLAIEEARQALEAGEFPVGCVIVAEGKVIARGRRRNSAASPLSELDHAEIVALRNLQATGSAPNLSGAVVYSTMEPCLMCYATLLLNGLTTIVYAYEDVMGGGTGLALQALPPLYAAMQVRVTPGICRTESLALFRRFFSTQSNGYLLNSELCRYTLSQG